MILKHSNTGSPITINHQQTIQTTGVQTEIRQDYNNSAVGTRTTQIQTGSTGLTIACDNAVNIASGSGTPIAISTVNATIGMNTGIGLTSVAPQLFTTSAVSSATVPQYVFQNNNSSTASYPAIKMDRPAATSVAGDTIATISTWADNYAGAPKEYVRISALAQNVGSAVTPTNVDGTLIFQTLVNDSFNTFISLNGSSQDVDIGKRLDMNGNSIATTTGNLVIDASASTGAGSIIFTPKVATGFIIMNNLPTSATGLPSGALWNNLGVLNIAP